MLNPNTLIEQNDIQLIVETLAKKSTSTFANKQEYLIKQASHFAPKYRDFIIKVLSNESLKISHEINEAYITPMEIGLESFNFARKHKNSITTDIYDPTNLPHELGHAVDFWFGIHQSLTNHVILSSEKTLREIFDQELESKREEILQTVMKEYKIVIDTNVPDLVSDIIMDNISLYLELRNLKENPRDKEVTKKRKIIQNQLYRSGFVDAYYRLHHMNKRFFSDFMERYYSVLDALSSKYDLKVFFLQYHTLSYYESSRTRPVQEFFANVFNAKVTAKDIEYEGLIKFFPQSLAAFEELFAIFYDHIQHNKPFTSVRTRKDINDGIL